jgi:hypothetical protein
MTASINASTSSGVVVTSDTSGALAVQSNGTTQFTVDSTGAYGQLKSSTAVASTSGTSIDFTSLPTWIERITVMFNGVGLNDTAIIQIGAGSVDSTGTYAGSMTYIVNASPTTSNNTASTGFYVNTATIGTITGAVTLYLVGSNNWVSSAVISDSGSARTFYGANKKSLSGTLDRVRITSTSGTGTFSAGTINILYEG